MKFVSTREMRNNPGSFRKALAREDVVLTANGKPFGLAVSVNEEELEETLDLLQRARAQTAITRMQRSAATRGLSRLSNQEIDKEIKAARRVRRKSR